MPARLFTQFAGAKPKRTSVGGSPSAMPLPRQGRPRQPARPRRSRIGSSVRDLGYFVPDEEVVIDTPQMARRGITAYSYRLRPDQSWEASSPLHIATVGFRRRGFSQLCRLPVMVANVTPARGSNPPTRDLCPWISVESAADHEPVSGELRALGSFERMWILTAPCRGRR
jgi:hypothetical protein